MIKREWELWFETNEEYRITAAFYGTSTVFTVEELYQMFKQRLLDEMEESRKEKINDDD